MNKLKLQTPSLFTSFTAGFLLIMLTIIFSGIFSLVSGGVFGLFASMFHGEGEELSFIFYMIIDVLNLFSFLLAVYCAIIMVRKFMKSFNETVVYAIFFIYIMQSLIGLWLMPEDMEILGININEIPNFAVKQTINLLTALGAFHYWFMVEKAK
jgi:hypothetical protein